MQLLYLSLDCPYPANNGLRLRTWSTLQALRAEGCRITLICLQSAQQPDNRTPLREVCESFWILEHQVASLTQGQDWLGRACALSSRLPYAARRFRSSGARELIQSLWAACPRDGVICDTVFAAVNVPAQLGPLILNHHNVEHRIFDSYAAVERHPLKRAAARWEGGKVRAWEARVGARAALNLVCSATDRDLLLQQQPSARVIVAPNITAIDSTARDPREDADTVLFCGALDWHPNRDAVAFFLERIWPRILSERPSARAVIAGRNPPPALLARYRHAPRLQFTGTVPDMRPYWAQAAVVVVPLRIGSGTRLKILEAAAMGKAIVSTRIGAEGLEFTPREIVLADDPAEFAAAVVDLLRVPERRRDLGRAARARVQTSYGPAALRQSVRAALAALRQPGRTETRLLELPEGVH